MLNEVPPNGGGPYEDEQVVQTWLSSGAYSLTKVCQGCIRTVTTSLLLQLPCRQLQIDGLLNPRSCQYGIK
jgi:hypothetical protein